MAFDRKGMIDMARIVKFALEMKNGFQARNNIEELRDNFDYGKIVGYLNDGRLVRWLANRGYEKEATELSELSVNDNDFKEKICAIMQVDESLVFGEDNVMDEELLNRLEKVRQYTADKTILDNIDKVATNQKELLELVDNNESEIYLCANSFVIPLVVENVTYIGIGNPIAVIKSSEMVDFSESNIIFKNISFDDEYMKICEKDFNIDNDGNEKINKNEKDGDDLFIEALEYYEEDNDKFIELLEKAAELGNSEAIFHLGFYYEDEGDLKEAKKWYIKAIKAGDVSGLIRMGHLCIDEEDYENAEKYYKRAADKGDSAGLYYLGNFYEYYQYDEKKALKFYRKAAEKNHGDSMVRMGRYYRGEKEYDEAMKWLLKASEEENDEAYNLIGCMYSSGEGVTQDDKVAFQWFTKAAAAGNHWGIYNLAQSYENGDGVKKNWNMAYDLYKEAAEKGNESAKKWLNKSMITPGVVAELLGVLIHGKLKNGKKLWSVNRSDYGSKLIKYVPLKDMDNDDLVGIRSSWLGEQMEKNNESIIGVCVESNFIDAWEYIFITEKSVYFQDENGQQYRRPYAGIVDVELPEAYKMIFVWSDGKRWEIPSSGKWNKDLGLENFRLFLLVMAKILGDCDYVFNDYEVGKLRMIELEEFDNESILDILDL